MKNTKKAVVLFLYVAISGAIIGSPLGDPHIPNGEVATYRLTEEGRETRFVERTEVIDTDGPDLYRIVYESEHEITRIDLEKATMLPREIDTESRNGELSIRNLTTINRSVRSEYDRIMVLSYSELKYLLRGFPFEADANLDVDFFSTEEDEEETNFRISIAYRGTQEIIAGDRTIPCHKLELLTQVSGVLRIFRGMIPKTFFWYSVAEPHYLVAYEGSSGFPGSPKSYVELSDYSGWD